MGFTQYHVHCCNHSLSLVLPPHQGKVYFDSGEYNQTKSSSSKAEIQARPHLPMMGKVKKAAVPSKLAQ
jgi:hypothetical protein